MEKVEGVRINKYLSEAGVCSRRQADALINEKRVRIDTELAQPGSKVCKGSHVFVDGKKVRLQEEMVLLAFNKPVGIVCTTTDKQGKNNIVDYIGYDKRIYPVGRLDKESEGLILMTNNGQLMDDILRSANGHEKEYIVEVDKRIDDDFVRAMSGGIYLEELDRTTNPCKVEKIGQKTFRIILTQGLNRQIRRMCASLGLKVVSLKRVRIMNIMLGDLKTGTYRQVTKAEYDKLLKLTKKDGRPGGKNSGKVRRQ